MLIDTRFTSAPLLRHMSRYLQNPAPVGSPYENRDLFLESVQSLSGPFFTRLLAQIEHVPPLALKRSGLNCGKNAPKVWLRDEMSSLFMRLAIRCDLFDESHVLTANACAAAALLATPKSYREDWAVEVCEWTLNDLAVRLQRPAQAAETAEILSAFTPNGHALAPSLRRIQKFALAL